VLSPEASVQFFYSEDIKNAEDSAAKRAELLDEWKNGEASPEKAAECGAIDDIIAYAETRARIISAVEMLFAKISGNPAKKHSKLPF
jgi:acetyl-CoA carboxylase carboxyltransferase component